MAKNSQEYWNERARQDKIKVIKTSEMGVDNLKKLLKKNLDSVEKQIKDFYKKYGDEGKYAESLSYAEFQKYKARLRLKAKQNPQDKTLQRLAKQDIPKYRIDRLRALQTDLQIQLTEATRGQEAGIYKTLKDVAKVSQATTALRFKKTLDVAFDKIASRKLEKILSSDWVGNMNWSERLWKDRELVGKKVTDILEEGIPQGKSMQDMARDLKDATNSSFNDAFRLIRTESAHVDGEVLLESFKQAKAELGYTKYIFDATIDNRTSEICAEKDNKSYLIDEAVIGENFPPLHPNCRSTAVLDESSIDESIIEESKQEEKEEETQEEKQIEPIGNKDVNFSNVVESARWKVQGQDYTGNIIAKDIATAEKIAEQNGVIYADFSKMSIDYANEINKALLTVPRKFRPDLVTDAKTLQNMNLLKINRKMSSFFGVSTSWTDTIKGKAGKYIEVSEKVAYNTTTYKTFESITKHKVEFNKKQKWFFNTDGRATIYHELAHSYANKNGIPKGFEELGKRWAKESNIGQIQTIDEAWAEAFAGYHIKNPELPDYIKEFMKGLKL